MTWTEPDDPWGHMGHQQWYDRAEMASGLRKMASAAARAAEGMRALREAADAVTRAVGGSGETL